MKLSSKAVATLRAVNSGLITFSAFCTLLVIAGLAIVYSTDSYLKPIDEIKYEESIAYTFQVYEGAWDKVDTAFEDNSNQVNRWKTDINHAIAYTDGLDAPELYEDHKQRTINELKQLSKDAEIPESLKSMLDALYALRKAEDEREIAYKEYVDSTLSNQLTRFQAFRGAQTEEELKRRAFYEKKDSFWESVQAYHNIIRPLGREISDNKLN